MERNALTTINRALKWSMEKETRREVKFESGFDWSSKRYNRVYVYDNQTTQGGYLPIPFKGNISKFLCQKEQNELQSTIDGAKDRLVKSVAKCKTMEE